jgi:hypothetical protein
MEISIIYDFCMPFVGFTLNSDPPSETAFLKRMADLPDWE